MHEQLARHAHSLDGTTICKLLRKPQEREKSKDNDNTRGKAHQESLYMHRLIMCATSAFANSTYAIKTRRRVRVLERERIRWTWSRSLASAALERMRCRYLDKSMVCTQISGACGMAHRLPLQRRLLPSTRRRSAETQLSATTSYPASALRRGYSGPCTRLAWIWVVSTHLIL